MTISVRVTVEQAPDDGSKVLRVTQPAGVDRDLRAGDDLRMTLWDGKLVVLREQPAPEGGPR